MRTIYSIAILLILSTLSACTTTFAGSLFVFGFQDLILYIFIAFIFAVLIGLQSENKRKTFWIWFALGILLTPLSSFIALLVKISRSV